MSGLRSRAAAKAALASAALAFTLSSTTLSVELDDLLPRALSYTLASTGESISAALQGWGLHASVSANNGQASCGELSMTTAYAPLPAAAGSASFTLQAWCAVNWLEPGRGGAERMERGASPPALSPALLLLNGTVGVQDDAAVPGAGVFTWTLTSASLQGGPGGVPVTTLDFIGFELLSFHAPSGPARAACMYTPTDTGTTPACGGDSYYVDAWSNSALDEWEAGTWTSTLVSGVVDVNTPAGTHSACFNPQRARAGVGDMASVIAGGWSASGKTGTASLSSQRHTPFTTGLTTVDVPGRCSAFTVASSTLYVSYLCGTGLPVTLTVGVFPDVTADGTVSGDDILLWRRMQFPRADVLYRTTLPYKIQIDMTAYTPSWTRMAFTDVLAYAANISAVTDGYPQTPILVGWQGLGHDTLYPGWDVLNIHPDVGGQAALSALASGLQAASRSNRSSLSFHVNADEGYSRFNGSANPDFDERICRLNVDHSTAWFENCTTVGFQTPDCGVRCSISKVKDASLYGRYARYARFFATVPASPPMRTIHSDAWRDVGASWEPPPPSGLGYLDLPTEHRCGSQADSAFWAAHGMSMGVEGNDGQAAELIGTVSFLYHGGGDTSGWSAGLWGRIVVGTSLGWDTDVSCNNPGWAGCDWDAMADAFYLSARVYQLALTDELLGSTTLHDGHRRHRFAKGGVLHEAHVLGGAPTSSTVPTPSTWPYGGDAIPILDGTGGALLPLVTEDGETLDPGVLHAYHHSSGGPDPDCPLFSTDPAVYTGADDTAVGNWDGTGPAGPYEQFEGDPSLPYTHLVSACNATCWANTTGCAGWDVIKVTPNSGRTKPLCMLFAHVAGCGSDLNQVAGVKAPLPRPNSGGVNQTWTLPLSWQGRALSATSLTPAGEVPGIPAVQVDGRTLRLVGVQPGWPVRLVLGA